MLSAGTKLGPYEIAAAIGAGGMGEVYRARDARLGRDVAVKVLPAALAADPAALARFEREMKTLAALSNPYIVAIYDVGQEGATAYAVTELLDRETLAAVTARGLPVDHRADIFAFGCVMYELVAGRRAFQRDSTADTLSAILKEDPPPISAVTVAVPPALERVIQRCLEKSPEERFQSARDLA